MSVIAKQLLMVVREYFCSEVLLVEGGRMYWVMREVKN
jgi:hypothetical protein